MYSILHLIFDGKINTPLASTTNRKLLIRKDLNFPTIIKCELNTASNTHICESFVIEILTSSVFLVISCWFFSSSFLTRELSSTFRL